MIDRENYSCEISMRRRLKLHWKFRFILCVQKFRLNFLKKLKKMIIVVGFQYRNLEIQGFKKNLVDWIFVFQTITIIGEFKLHPHEILVEILGFLKIFSKFQNSNQNSRISTVSPTIVINQISIPTKIQASFKCFFRNARTFEVFHIFFLTFFIYPRLLHIPIL